jgi:hypothetical protein
MTLEQRKRARQAAARGWTLLNLLNDRKAVALFRTHLEKVFADDNLDVWEDFKKVRGGSQCEDFATRKKLNTTDIINVSYIRAGTVNDFLRHDGVSCEALGRDVGLTGTAATKNFRDYLRAEVLEGDVKKSLTASYVSFRNTEPWWLYLGSL